MSVELTRCFVFTVVDLLPNGAQGNRLLDDIIVVRYLHTKIKKRKNHTPHLWTGSACVCRHV